MPTSWTDRPKNIILNQFCKNTWCQHFKSKYWVTIVSIWAKNIIAFSYWANIVSILAGKKEFGRSHLILYQHYANITTDRPKNKILSQCWNNLWWQYIESRYWVNIVSIWAKNIIAFWYWANIVPILTTETEFGPCHLILYQYCANIKNLLAYK